MGPSRFEKLQGIFTSEDQEMTSIKNLPHSYSVHRNIDFTVNFFRRIHLRSHYINFTANIHERKKSTKINFLGPETARWGGGLPREGVVAKNFVLSLESLSSLGFEGRESAMSREFCRDVPGPLGVFKKLVLKKFVCIFCTLNMFLLISLCFTFHCSTPIPENNFELASQLHKTFLARINFVIHRIKVIAKSFLGTLECTSEHIRKGVVEFKGGSGSLHDVFGGFDGLGSSGDHLALILLVLKDIKGQRGNCDGFGGFGGCSHDSYPLTLNPPFSDILS